MSLAAWIIDHFLPSRPSREDPRLDAAFHAASRVQQRTVENAQGAAAALERHRHAVAVESERIKARTARAEGRRKAGQTSAVALAVEDALQAPSFRGADNDEG